MRIEDERLSQQANERMERVLPLRFEWEGVLSAAIELM